MITRNIPQSSIDSCCVACGGEIGLFGPSGAYQYFRCRSCDTLQLHPMPESGYLDVLYAEKFAKTPQTKEFGNPEVWNKVAFSYHEAVINCLKQHRQSGLVIDFGAGWGGLVDLLVRSGYDCIGVEKNADEVIHARSCGLPVRHGGLEQVADKKGQVAAITMCAVWEHLTDYSDWLSRMNELLMPGGLIVTMHPTSRLFILLSTVLRLGRVSLPIPDFDATFAAPWHTVIFSVEGTKMLASKHGFDCLEVQPAPQGRRPGLIGVVQLCLEKVNRLGWTLCQLNWPLVTGHVFVFQKRR